MTSREEFSGGRATIESRFAVARDAAIRSFFNRFGRAPTEDEFRQSIGHFLPGDLQRLARKVGSGSDLPDVGPAELGTNAPTVESRHFARDTIGWLLRQRLGRTPSAEEVEAALRAYRQPSHGEPAVTVETGSLAITRRSPSLRPPPFERAPLFPSASSFYERSVLPVLRWPNRFLPLDHVPDTRSVGGRLG